MLVSRAGIAGLIELLLSVAPAAAAELPVLFVHGFCSSANTWAETLPQPSERRFGGDVPRIYESAIGKAAVRASISAAAKTFRIDFSDLANGFDLLAIANVPTVRKARELKVVIDAAKRFTGALAVSVVAHSLGGLATRAYIQGLGRNRSGAAIPYGSDVAALIMISTPNQGSALANLSGKPGAESCVVAAFERDGILHLRVHNEATTVALFTGIISDLDDEPHRH